MRASVSPNGQALLSFDEFDEEDQVPGSWFHTIYKDVSEYLADQIRPDVVRPRQMPARIDIEAMWGGK
jgi:hypothetical protein